MSTFRKDLARERRTIAHLYRFLEVIPTVEEIKEPDKPSKTHDFSIRFSGGGVWSCEVKEDFYCRRSNNLAVEFTSRGKPSGIVTTTADVWGFIAHREHGRDLYFIKTVILRWLIATERYRKVFHNAGDKGSNTGIYLFPISIIQKYSLFLGTLDHENPA